MAGQSLPGLKEGGARGGVMREDLERQRVDEGGAAVLERWGERKKGTGEPHMLQWG